jgi:hypothetical protein
VDALRPPRMVAREHHGLPLIGEGRQFLGAQMIFWEV